MTDKDKILEVLQRNEDTFISNPYSRYRLAEEIATRLQYDKDPNRIPEVVQALEDAWKESPEQRLGQFIYNVFLSGHERPSSDEEELNIIYNKSDEEWKELLKEYASRKD